MQANATVRTKARSNSTRSPWNVFYVDTPLQLLNALEAKLALGLENTALVVVTWLPRRAQLEALIEKRDWDEVYTVTDLAGMTERSPRLRLYKALHAARRQVDDIVRNLGEADTLLLGNHGSPIGQHIASSLRYRRLVILDDGMATLALAEHRARTVSGSQAPHRLRRRLRNMALGLRSHDADNVTFFTSYDVAVAPRDHVIRNEYDRIRSLTVSAQLVPETLFLGQPLVEDNQVDEDVYLRYVRAAQHDGGGDELVYAPHPRESLERVHRLQRLLGFELRINTLPVEIELARSGRLPTTLASFCSSAIDNCRILFGGTNMKIMAYVIADEELLAGRNGALSHMYDYLRRHEGPGFVLREVAVPNTDFEESSP